MAVREDGRLDLRAAIDLREQALSVYRALLPEVDQRTGVAVQNLAVTWEASGDGVGADRVLAEHMARAVSQGADADEVASRGPFATALPSTCSTGRPRVSSGRASSTRPSTSFDGR